MIGIEKFAYLAMFMFLNYNLFAQTDSLKNIYTTQNDYEKIETVLLVCDFLHRIPKASLSYSRYLKNFKANDSKICIIYVFQSVFSCGYKNIGVNKICQIDQDTEKNKNQFSSMNSFGCIFIDY